MSSVAPSIPEIQIVWVFNSFLFSAAAFVLDQMELLSLVVILFSLHHLWECRDERRVSGSDTDRSHAAPREMPKCYKDEPYGQLQHLRPLIGIFKQL